MTVRKYSDFHKIIGGVEYKQCKDCLEWFEMNDENFNINNGNKDKYNMLCKRCQKEDNHKRYMANREYRLEKAIQWKREHPEKYWTEEYQKTKKAYDAKRSTKLTNKQCAQRARDAGKILEWWRSNPEKQKQYTLKRKSKEHEITTKEWLACKNNFNNSCAYCGLKEEEHFKKYNGILKLQELHKEHVDDKGSNGISNCVPSCHICNSEKHTDQMDEWYRQQDFFTEEKYNKILKWITEGYKEFIEERPPYRITKRRNENGGKFHWELWTVDEARNMIECVDIKDKKNDLDLSLIHII